MLDSEKLSISQKRAISRPVRVCETIGRDCGRLYRLSHDIDTVTGCPYLIYWLSLSEDGYRLEFVGDRYESEGIDLTDSLDRFKPDGFPSYYGLIGYDTEYETDEISSHQILSHQLAFWVNGVRFGLVISTDIRFTDSFFLELLGQIVQRLTGFDVKRWYIFAHFSLAEGSWLDNRPEKQIKHRGANSWKNGRIIQREGKSWLGRLILFREEQLKKNGESYKKPRFSNVWLSFCDTMNLYAASLKVAAAGLGFEKAEPKGDISKMSTVRAEQFEDFCRYGVRDAILCTAIPLDIHSRFACLGSRFKARTAAYSETFFKQFFEEHYKDYCKHWQQLLGQVHIKSDDGRVDLWKPGKLQKRCLKRWYYGGRNEVHRVGCFGEAYYHDLTSAYPSSVIMMPADYDFSESYHYWGREAESEITKLRKRGPYQPHAVTVFCRFKSSAVPMFPTRIDGAIVFPQIFHGTVTWPEYWTAVELDLLEECTVIELTVFKELPNRHLPEKIQELLLKRKTDKLLYKNLLNFHYGKTVQGVSGDVPFSSVSCPALGAYMTGFCRASVGELANLNSDYYAITTDGFISPHKELKTGSFNVPVTKKLNELGYEWIGIDASGTESFFIKTRGYALWNDEEETGKIAAMGVQARGDVTNLIRQLRAGKATKTRWLNFRSLKPGEILTRETSTMTVNTTFDMKHIPIPDTIEETGVFMNGEFIALPTFETRPLKDAYEYEHLRSLADFKNYEKFEELKRRGLSASEISELITAYAIQQPQSRRLMWWIRHRLTTEPDLKRSETTLTEKQWNAYQRTRPYELTLTAEELDRYRWLFRHELSYIKDKEKRRTLNRKFFSELKTLLSDD